MPTILAVYGTRPEAIKMAPLVSALAGTPDLHPVVAVTGQHRQMLDQVNDLFGIVPSYDLDVIGQRQTLEDITSRVLTRLEPVLAAERPDAVVVQGDTTTCFASALSAFYHQIPVVHVEAGLRTEHRYNPFPEEMNRRLTTRLASLHLAPTAQSKANLLADGVAASDITVTGNTVIDALMDVVGRGLPIRHPALSDLAGRRIVLVTAHRRESWGEPMRRTSAAIGRLAEEFPGVTFVLPAHLNPTVREVLLPLLTDQPNVIITDPLDYVDFAGVMSRAELVVTDSGGVQEEAPSLGKPVLVLRDTTERPEAVDAGTVALVGTDEPLIHASVSRLLTNRLAYDSMAHAVNPYGDGQAARRSVAAIRNFFGLGPRAEEFEPSARPLPSQLGAVAS